MAATQGQVFLGSTHIYPHIYQTTMASLCEQHREKCKKKCQMRKEKATLVSYSPDSTTNFKTRNPEFSRLFEAIRLFLTKTKQDL